MPHQIGFSFEIAPNQRALWGALQGILDQMRKAECEFNTLIDNGEIALSPGQLYFVTTVLRANTEHLCNVFNSPGRDLASV